MTFDELLKAEGYRLAFRLDGFVEVLAAKNEERFVGRGHDDAQALDDLRRVMFPSAVAKTLLERACASAHPEPAAIVVAEPAAAPAELAAPQRRSYRPRLKKPRRNNKKSRRN